MTSLNKYAGLLLNVLGLLCLLAIVVAISYQPQPPPRSHAGEDVHALAAFASSIIDRIQQPVKITRFRAQGGSTQRVSQRPVLANPAAPAEDHHPDLRPEPKPCGGARLPRGRVRIGDRRLRCPPQDLLEHPRRDPHGDDTASHAGLRKDRLRADRAWRARHEGFRPEPRLHHVSHGAGAGAVPRQASVAVRRRPRAAGCRDDHRSRAARRSAPRGSTKLDQYLRAGGAML